VPFVDQVCYLWLHYPNAKTPEYKIQESLKRSRPPADSLHRAQPARRQIPKDEAASSNPQGDTGRQRRANLTIDPPLPEPQRPDAQVEQLRHFNHAGQARLQLRRRSRCGLLLDSVSLAVRLIVSRLCPK